MLLHGMITKKYAWELQAFEKYSETRDFDIGVLLNLGKGDHEPCGKVTLVLWGFLLFEFHVYNINHAAHPDDV